MAENYNPDATLDDLSCVYPCTLALEESSVLAPTCNGENDGGFQVIATGAQGADYFFLDSIPGGAFDEPTAFGGQNFGNFFGKLAGEYLVWVFDGAGCTDSLTVEIPVKEPVSIEIQQDSVVSCAGADDAVVSISSVTGGNGDFTFYISNDPTVSTTQTQWSGLSGNHHTASSPLIQRGVKAHPMWSLFLNLLPFKLDLRIRRQQSPWSPRVALTPRTV